MSFHADYDQWLAMTEPRHCPVCQHRPMSDTAVTISDLPSSWLTTEPAECLPGACHLIAKRHVIELYELNDADLLALMRDVKVCARALKTVTQAVKINYEIHGNTVPHLHVHLYPRYRDDPFPNQPINYHQRKCLYSEAEFRGFVGKMRQMIAENFKGA